jgi:protein SCO1/2
MLCTQVINGLASALGVLSLEPGRTSRSSRSAAIHDAGGHREGCLSGSLQAAWRAAAWHFLTGGPAAIEEVNEAAGFRYVWDDQTKQFAHPTGVIVLTPEGRLARYLFGIEYGPRDLRLALVEASAGKVGTPVDALLLYCYHYDPMTGRYGLVIMRAMRIAGALTVFALAGFIFIMLRREKRHGWRSAPSPQSPAPGHQPGTF